jgi:hypothetical protein
VADKKSKRRIHKKSRPSLSLTGQISFRIAKVEETFKPSGEFQINAMSAKVDIHDSTRIRHRANWAE